MSPLDLLLEHLTWREVRAALDAGRTTVVVPAGAVEQHGPHLPLFVDAEHGTRLAVEVARRLGDALVAPTIRVGCSEHHMAFAGTVSVRPSTFEAICLDYCTSLARHGFRRICFVPSHGGNFGPLGRMLARLNDAVAPDARVTAYTDLNGFLDIWRRAVEAEAGLGGRVGGHADIAESSIMLTLHPDHVRRDRAEAGFAGEITPEVLDRMFREGMDAVAPNGILGDARGMSPEIGERCIREAAEVLAAHFRG